MIPIPTESLTNLRAAFIKDTGLGTPTYTITPRSPWPSELFALYAFGKHAGVKSWIEGGTYHGQTANVLSHAMPETTIATVEIDAAIAEIAAVRLDGRAKVEVGDAHEALPRLAKTLDGPIGVFIDGPKGIPAALLARTLMDRYPKVAFVGCHDMSQSRPGRAVPGRAALEELGRYETHQSFWATDDKEYVTWAQDLDEGFHAQHTVEGDRSGWAPYNHIMNGCRVAAPSYGPTIAFLLRE